MVEFMLNAPGEKSVRLEFESLTVGVQCFDDDSFRTKDVEPDLGETQAALFFRRPAGWTPNFWIDEDPLVLRVVLLAAEIDDEEPLRDPHLGSGETDPPVFVHDLEHPSHPGPQPIVELRHG